MYGGDTALSGRRRPHLTTLAIRRKGIVTIPEAIREELDLHEGDHLVATVEDGRLVLIPASVTPDDQAWFWTPEWQAKEAEADQQIADLRDGRHPRHLQASVTTQVRRTQRNGLVTWIPA